jgi:hypothetical protein
MASILLKDLDLASVVHRQSASKVKLASTLQVQVSGAEPQISPFGTPQTKELGQLWLVRADVRSAIVM